MKINFILPFFPELPGGGHKVMYEYALNLSERGHSVSIYHSMNTSYLKYKYPYILRKFRAFIKRIPNKPLWFTFPDKIKIKNIHHVSDKYIDDADILISTWWATAIECFNLSPKKGKRINLIQDYETWTGNVDEVHRSYKLPVVNIVISKYLFELVKEISGNTPIYIPNAIDHSKFFIKNPIDSRDPFSIAMIYSEEKRKDTSTGIEVLRKLKKIFPDIRLDLFGIYSNPNFPENWINYHQTPKNLIDIYNNSAIFFTPSLKEGWGLPATEAMRCGCALICTDIDGHKDYAVNNKTAITVIPGDIENMTERFCKLLENNSYRIQIATSGNEYIQSFSWNNSVTKLELLF